MTKTVYVEGFPQWALSAAINGDRTGLTERDCKLLDDWTKENGEITTISNEKHDYYSEGYFSKYPVFGLPCSCETVILLNL